jgi:hypothetical protein
MRPADSLLQHLIDGEANGAEAAAAEHLLASDPALADRYKFLSDIDLLAKHRACAVTSDHTANAVLSAQLMDRLPAALPHRRVHVEIGSAVAALLISSVCTAGFFVAGTMDDLLPLTWMALGSIVGGLVIVLGIGGFRPRRDEDTSTYSSGRLRAPTPPGLLRRLLGYRFALGDGELLLYRAVGCILMVGGCYLAIRGLN